MIRAVVDSHIILRGLLKPQGAAGNVLRGLVRGAYTAVYSDALIDELLAKLALPALDRKYHTRSTAEDLLALLALRGEPVASARALTVCPTPANNRLIEAAVAGRAACIVSSDDEALRLYQFEGIRITSPRAFLQML